MEVNDKEREVLLAIFPSVFGFNLALTIAANIQKLGKRKRNKKLSEL